jgi:thiol-disulfide isomerase/thioredoxin
MDMKTVFGFLAVMTAFVGGIAIWLMNDHGNKSQPALSASLAAKGRMPSLENATAWLNTEPLSASTLRGKVVLVDFWTYSCINWRRQLPYVRAWADKYKDKGLVVVGVHTPEFPFEKNIENVRWSAKEMDIVYPIALDSEYAIWEDFANHYWPALYFVDAGGNIRHEHFGEGDYERSEKVIQQLLREAGRTDIDDSLVSVEPQGAEADAAWGDLHSPETYAGYDRTTNFASAGGYQPGKIRQYEFPSRLELFEWALSGEWTFAAQSVTSSGPTAGARIAFHARDIHMVMGPSTTGTPVRFRVLIDGKPPGNSHGADVDEHGNGTIVEQKMYQLIRQPKPITGHVFEIQFLDAGAEVFVFTFG